MLAIQSWLNRGATGHRWQKSSGAEAGMAEKQQSNTSQTHLTTSYSWALTLPLHFAGKCSFSFVDYKIHDPKKKKITSVYSCQRQNISITLKCKNMNIPLVLFIKI